MVQVEIDKERHAFAVAFMCVMLRLCFLFYFVDIIGILGITCNGHIAGQLHFSNTARLHIFNNIINLHLFLTSTNIN